jgi:FkbM family methyltransferase
VFQFNRVQSLLRNLKWLLRTGGLHAHLDAHCEELHDLASRVHDMQNTIDCLRRHAWVYGHHMLLDPDDAILSPYICQHSYYEQFETELIQRIVRPGNRVLDIGANIGYYTLHFARLVGPQGHVFAFEPDPQNFALLKSNVRQNRYTNVTLVQKAVWSCSKKIRLFRNNENRGDHRTYESSHPRESVEVDAIALDDFFSDDDGPIDFIKFDIQGAEGAAFQGMSRLLARCRELRIFTEFWPRGLHTSGYNAEEFLRRLLGLDFNIRVIDERAEQLLPLDVRALLDRLPIEPDNDIYFTNLFCERTEGAPFEYNYP